MAKAKAKAKPKPKAKSGAPKSLVDKQLKKVRAFVHALPNVTEKISHGFPGFFVKKKGFAYFLDNHHGDGRLALWCMAPLGAQAALVDANSDHYFVPPYVGVSGWVGVRLDRDAEWPQIAAVLESAYETRAAKK
jgi:hypothetical protein